MMHRYITESRSNLISPSFTPQDHNAPPLIILTGCLLHKFVTHTLWTTCRICVAIMMRMTVQMTFQCPLWAQYTMPWMLGLSLLLFYTAWTSVAYKSSSLVDSVSDPCRLMQVIKPYPALSNNALMHKFSHFAGLFTTLCTYWYVCIRVAEWLSEPGEWTVIWDSPHIAQWCWPGHALSLTVFTHLQSLSVSH